jgi:hypothetical protein
VFHEIADDVNRDEVLTPPPTEKRSEAEALILAELAQGRRLSAEVKAVGAKVGISAATMKRAAVELEVVVEEETTESGRVTYWALLDALGGRLTPYHTRGEPTPHVLHDQAEKGVGSGGSAHEYEIGAEPTPDGAEPPVEPCPEHPDAGAWLASDSAWRCTNCDPWHWRSEVVQECP